jgi:hypothetical protein
MVHLERKKSIALNSKLFADHFVFSAKWKAQQLELQEFLKNVRLTFVAMGFFYPSGARRPRQEEHESGLSSP